MKTQATIKDIAIDYKVLNSYGEYGHYNYLIQYDFKELKEVIETLDLDNYFKLVILAYEGTTRHYYNGGLNELVINDYIDNKLIEYRAYTTLINNLNNMEGEIYFLNVDNEKQDLKEFKIVFNETYNYLEQGQQEQLIGQDNQNLILGLGLGLGLPIAICSIILTFTSIYKLFRTIKKDNQNLKKEQ